MFQKIMVAFDESSEAGRALRASIELGRVHTIARFFC
jgi:hypothetical protein